MKYNEAIDMILDGGEAYRKVSSGFRYRFNGDDELFESANNCCWEDGTEDCYFTKADFTATDWIVEKDGVVYEEYQSQDDRMSLTEKHRKSLMELIGSLEAGEIKPEDLGLKNKYRLIMILDRLQNQDEPAELEESGKSWEEIKMHIMTTEEIRESLESQFPPKHIIADEVNEEWLEKKVRCIIRRDQKHNHGGFINPEFIMCGLRNCPFCLPKEQPTEEEINSRVADYNKRVERAFEKAGYVNAGEPHEKCSICGESEKLRSSKYTIAGIIYCEDCNKNNPELNAQYPEPLTVEDMEWLLEKYIEERDSLREAVSNLESNETIRKKETLVRLNLHYLMREIKYLVSLQGK